MGSRLPTKVMYYKAKELSNFQIMGLKSIFNRHLNLYLYNIIMQWIIEMPPEVLKCILEN